MKLIDKDALVAEIEKLENKNKMNSNDFNLGASTYLGIFKHFLNTHEVKEVDINKEISQFIDANFEKATIGHKLSLRRKAKHFFELGMNTSKGKQ